jgi:hypothetical protein
VADLGNQDIELAKVLPFIFIDWHW